jgi:adenine-specific DNA-methyltransferase
MATTWLQYQAATAKRKTSMPELVWDGKYDASGKRVAPVKIALPFQTIETVNESTADRARTRSLFAQGAQSEWRNRLIWGDKKYVLPSLLREFAGSVNLIYIDPPFDTGADFSFTAQIPDDPNTPGDQSASFTKEPSILELKAYRDIWGGAKTHLDAYLKWFYETAVLLHELLHENGSIYVHLDYHVSSHAKLVLDEVFGIENFRNEIIWKRTSSRSDASTYNHIHDTIFFYTKSDKFTLNQQFTEHSEEYSEGKYNQVDKDGRRYRLDNMTSPNPRPNMMYEWKGFNSPEKGWRYSKETMARLDAEGRIWYPQDKSRRPQFIRYLDENKGRTLDSIWGDIFPVNSQAVERLAYRTQKPEALLERIIKASSNEGDLVLDCFCGSGTTAAVAEKRNRRWITCDLGRFAIHTARKRLLGIPQVKPFEVQNLGKYERQAWQKAEFERGAAGASTSGASSDESLQRQRAYIDWMLQLYRAQPLTGYVWLHGVRNGRFVHVGGVDAPVTDADLKQIALEFRRAVGTGENAPTSNGIDVLGWEWAFEINEAKKQSAAQANVDFAFKRIPREVMEKRAVEQGDIQFLELAALQVQVLAKGKAVTLELENFSISPDYVPADVARQITHWEQYLDYWAVDWNNPNSLTDTFHNQWQSYRTRADKTLKRRAEHVYEAPGTYRVVVKAIDILGNDTTKVLEVTVS